MIFLWILLSSVSLPAHSADSPSPTPSTSQSAPTPAAAPAPKAKKALSSNPLGNAALASEEPKHIDVLRQQLFKLQRSKKAKAVGRAVQALKEQHYDKARSIARTFRSDEQFADLSISLTARADREEAADLLKKSAFAQAIALAKKAIPLYLKIEEDYPYSSILKKLPEELAEAEVVIADGYHGQKKWKTSIEHYERAFQRFSTSSLSLSPLRPENLGNYAEACSKVRAVLCPVWTQRFATVYPRNSEEIRAIAEFIPEIADIARPAHPVGKLTQTYRGVDLDQASFEKASALYFSQKYSDAIKALNQFLDEFPKSSYRFRARYWLAQALTQDQDHDKAKKVYDVLMKEAPLTYYGLLAAMATGKSLDTYIDGNLPQAASMDPALHPSEVLRLRRAERFIVEGVDDLAAQDLKDFRPRDTLSSPFLMYLASLNYEAGNYANSFIFLSDLIQRGYDGVYSSYGLRLIFPMVYMDLVQKHATDAKLDPILVLSLIKQESAFDVDAVSAVGAAGLMQLMPYTAVETEATVNRADLIEADTNIRVGTRYLKKLLDRFNGNIVFALASYNAGPNAVLRWIREGKSKDGMIEFIENIPYRETRDYVSSIIRNYFWYAKKINGETPKNLSYFWNMYGPPELPNELPQMPAAGNGDS